MKHTPGPWEFELENGEGGEWYSFNGPVLSWGWSDYAAGEQAKADARLIAAAPDLLEACTRMEPVLSWLEDQGEMGASIAAQIRPIVNAAIKKAESE